MLFASTVTAALHALSHSDTTRPFYGEGNWQVEKHVGFVFTRPGAGPSTVLLEEYYHLKTNQFIYSIDKKEISGLNPSGGVNINAPANRWTRGVRQYYVFPTEGPNRVPLHRFSNGKDWLYSTDRHDAAAVGYSYDGVSCWLPAGPAVPGGIGPLYRWVRN
jgi:hypothetical protein